MHNRYMEHDDAHDQLTIVWSPPSATIRGCSTPSLANADVLVAPTAGLLINVVYATSIWSMAFALSIGVTGTYSQFGQHSRTASGTRTSPQSMISEPSPPGLVSQDRSHE